jgi:phosphate transport system substrate-binding protein
MLEPLIGINKDVLLSTAIISLLFGSYLGRRHAKRSDLPDSFALRYWPLVAPMAFILAFRVFTNTLTLAEPSFYADETLILLALLYLPIILSFAVCVPPESKLANSKWCWQTCVFIVILFVVLAWQAKLDSDNKSQNRYYGATILDEILVQSYWPWEKNNWLGKLDVPVSLVLYENYPTVDGESLFVPIYSAVVNEIYKVNNKNDLQSYMTCSGSAEAYNRLICGEVDMIFVFKPTNEHLVAAKDAGIELNLTRIAKEAFVFFVNRNNSVSSLSLEQIKDIYQKKITNWQQVGGNDKRILSFQRPNNSGSQTVMLNDVMKDVKLPPPLIAEYSGKTEGMYRDVGMYRDYEESIGYSFRFYAQAMVKSLISISTLIFAIQTDPDAEPIKLLSVNGIAPTAENIRNGSYPFTQEIYVVTAGTQNPNVRELIDWLLSEQGQELIEKVGYVGLR